MFKRKMIWVFIALGLALFLLGVFLIQRGETNAVKLINETDQPVCLFAYEEQILKNRAGETSVTGFKVHGDGDFYITDCEGKKTVKDLGYYTRSLSGCHIINVRDYGATLDWSLGKSACYAD